MPRFIRMTCAGGLLAALLIPPAVSAHAQQQNAGPNPPTSVDSSGVLTLHTGTHLVVLDVSVLDWKGYPVADLKKEQFHLLEDGHEQAIRNFEEHVPIDPRVARERLAALTQALPPNTFTNFKPLQMAATVNVVVMDTLTSRIDTQQNFHADLATYMRTVPPGTPFIVFKLDTGLHMVQELSMDPAVLRDAIGSRRLPYSQVGNTTFLQKRMIIGSAVDQLTRYLGGIPGRKTLLWFSGGLGIELSSTGDRNDSAEGDLLCKWTDDLQQHRIAAYRYLPERRFSSGLGCSPGLTVDGTIGDVVDSASHFYTLSYTPTNADWNGKYRKFKVNVSGRRGLSFNYREGYYARPDDGSVRSQEPPSAPSPNGESPTFQKAMGMGSPEPDDLIFEAVATPDSVIVKDDAAAVASSTPGNYLSAQLRKQGYRQCAVRFAVRADQFKLLQATDQAAVAAKMEVAAVLYDSLGQQVNSKKARVSAAFDSSADPRLQTVSVTADIDIQLPAKGSYFLRLGVRDPTSDRVGTLEIPIERIVLPRR